MKQAFQAEFLAGNIYSARGTPIVVELTELKPDSFGGKWTIGLNVASSKGSSYNVRTVYNFKTSFSAIAACNNTADAFNRALAQSINDVVSNPRFRSLL
ncbi:hypothetical protein [Roseovarius gaetbuli]|uniref:hypothetical protein n=1 Tax=Roseovarius gaetbuli TaxID=1356575 RepID=UPI001482745E|nr:hypothetical protein [Roseovarius gaetbuli]